MKYSGHQAALRNPHQVNHTVLDKMEMLYRKKGYPVAKWMLFCRKCVNEGFFVNRVPARTTESSYLYISNGTEEVKVRFSAHPPSKYRLEDVFAVVGPKGVTEEKAFELVKEYLRA